MLHRKCILVIVSLFFAMTFSVMADVNGEIDYVDGFRVMRLWGSHEEMGYAHGYLLGAEIKELFHDYFLWVVDPWTYENIIKPAFRQWMAIPAAYQSEMEHLLAGMVDSGCGIYSDVLNRDLTPEDIAIVNSIVDYSQFTDFRHNAVLACSSICGWGPGTAPEPSLPGGTLHCRDMDWSDNPDRLLGNRSLIIAYASAIECEQPLVCVSFPGFIACLSGMNAHGVGATLNMGNHPVQPSGASGIVPICFQVRQALETRDPNGDLNHDAEDVWYVLEGNSRVPSTIVHAFGPYFGSDAADVPSLVIESNWTGIAKRLPADDPGLAPDFIAATNHDRKLYPPVSCSRYATIVSMVSVDYQIDTAEAWSIESAVSLAWTVQTMLFRPDVMDLFVSANTDGTPAPQKTPSHMTWAEVFALEPTSTPTGPTPSPTPTSMTPTPPTETPTVTPTLHPTTTQSPPTSTPTSTQAPPTHTPTSTQAPPTHTPTFTPVQTSTPTQTPSPSVTVHPTQTPSPPTHTPTHTPTQSPYDAQTDLYLSDSLFEPGERFVLTYSLTNLSPFETVTGNFWLLLDVYGLYWFYPGWSTAPVWQAVSIDPDSSIGPETALDFFWPVEAGGHADNLKFIAALIDLSNSYLLSNLEMVTFGY